MRAYLDYYEQHNIIPVRQNIDDLQAHFNKRKFLYHSLGIHDFTFLNADILEVGPGTGDNAVYIASRKPKSYTLLDGNKASIQALEKKRKDGMFKDCQKLDIIYSDLLQQATTKTYDIVIAEGCLSGQLQPEVFLKKLSECVNDSGFLIITTQTPSSLLAEVCRRMFYPILKNQYSSDTSLMAALKEILVPHLKTLQGMNRNHEDWILDNITNPWGNSDSVAFSIADAINTISNEFNIIGTSPRFITDWRWYKSVDTNDMKINQQAIINHEELTYLFLDYRYHSVIDNNIDGKYLTTLCKNAYDYQSIMHTEGSLRKLPEFLECLTEISNCVKTSMPKTYDSLNDYLHALPRLINGNTQVNFNSFTGFFGRGLQFASFVKR